MKCKVCNHYTTDSTANFCGNCGAEFTKKQKLPYIGDCRDRGVFRITFSPVEDEFNNEDTAEDAARHSAWGEDREFEDFKVVFIRSTVTRETHPFICNNCREYVATHIEGRCDNCGASDWVQRTDETEQEKENWEEVEDD